MPRKLQINMATRKRIFKYMCDGDSVKTVARKLGIHRTTIYSWMHKDPQLKVLVDEARKVQADVYVGDLLEIADDDSKDIIVDDSTGRKYPNAANVARSKLKISTRKQLSGYYNPETYGEKTKVDVTSSDSSLGFIGLQIIPPMATEELENNERELLENVDKE